jgi:hypothetical protein
MSQSIEWAHAVNPVRLVQGDEDAGDGNTPDDELAEGNLALIVEGCAIYGKPAELLEFLSGAISTVSGHLAGTD